MQQHLVMLYWRLYVKVKWKTNKNYWKINLSNKFIRDQFNVHLNLQVQHQILIIQEFKIPVCTCSYALMVTLFLFRFTEQRNVRLLLLSVCSLIVYKKISMDGNVTAMGYMFIFYHRPDQMINFFNILLADGHAVKILCHCE